MRYIIALITCGLLFTQCSKPDIETYPTGTYDTLGIRWMTIERNNITYHFQGTGVKGASLFTDLHEDAYNRLQPIFKAKLPRKLRLFVWTDWEDAAQKLGHRLGFATPLDVTCYITATQSLGHEITHILSFWADGIVPTRETRFVTEGVAVAFDLNDNDKIEDAKTALEGQNIQSVTDLWSGNRQEASEEIFYPVAGAFMQFIYTKNLPEKFSALLRNQTLEDAEDIYGKDQLHVWIAEFDGLIDL